MDAALASALCDAQTAAATLERNQQGDKGAYTSSDVIALNARECLNKHGLSWMRTGVEIRSGELMHSMEDPENAEHTGSDIGMQCYAGDVLTKWILIHKDGGSIEGTSAMAVITSRGRPHDKAVAASLTYLTGQTLLRILCWDRETKEAVDKRKEQEASAKRGQRSGRTDSEPRESSRRTPPPRLPTLREQVFAQVDKVASGLRMNKGAAWSECLAAAELPSDLGGDKGPGSDDVTDKHLAALLRASHEVLRAGVSDPPGAP